MYADREDGIERRRVLTVLDQVLTTMTKVLAPVLPHLAEENMLDMDNAVAESSGRKQTKEIREIELFLRMWWLGILKLLL